MRKNKQVPYKGVTIRYSKSKKGIVYYEAKIYIKGIVRYLGCSKDPRECALMFDKMFIFTYGNYGVTNKSEGLLD